MHIIPHIWINVSSKFDGNLILFQDINVFSTPFNRKPLIISVEARFSLKHNSSGLISGRLIRNIYTVNEKRRVSLKYTTKI
jgi:hypothetical protein